MSQGYDSPGSIILRCPSCGSVRVRPSRRWYGLLLALGLLQRCRCEACGKGFTAFVWQRVESRREGAGLRFRTVCDSAELVRLSALQGGVNDRPMFGAAPGALMFLVDEGRRLEADRFEITARTRPVGAADTGQLPHCDLTFMSAWDRLPSWLPT